MLRAIVICITGCQEYFGKELLVLLQTELQGSKKNKERANEHMCTCIKQLVITKKSQFTFCISKTC